MLAFDCLRALAATVCFLIFLRGFFPLKNVSRGYSTRKFIPYNIPDPNYSEEDNEVDLLGLDISVAVAVDNVSQISASSGSSSRSKSNTKKWPEEHHLPSNEDGDKHIKINAMRNMAPYKRLVIMVIDALRTDFMFGTPKHMSKTNHLLRMGHGLSFIAESHPPTVTLPRLKAITTGGVPSFVDVVFNFGSSALTEDNIITQMKINKKKIVFFGDDTWVNLFPNHFERFDGTTSFFVMDYTEVDNNVTRHLQRELGKDADWDVMILHYLGLDHIGHFAGPKSPLIRPKLAEMDRIIARIYSALENWSDSGIPSLLVVCGDHGMSDQGGHGGATSAEISVPVLFLSPLIKAADASNTGAMSQTDLCPTLSVLLGLPVPMNNLGKVIVDTLEGYSLEQKLSVIHQNFLQVMKIFKSQVRDVEKESAFLLYDKTHKDYQNWLKEKNTTNLHGWEAQGEIILVAFTECLHLMAEKVGQMSIQYDVYAMATSIVLLWLLLISLIMSHLKKVPKHSSSATERLILLLPIVGSALMTHIIMCTAGVPSNLICSSSPLSILIQGTIAVIFISCMLHISTDWAKCLPLSQQILHFKEALSFSDSFIILSTFGHTLTLLSSSFVEEEHQTFYFLTTTLHILLLITLTCRTLNARKNQRKLDSNSLHGNQIYDGLNYNVAGSKNPSKYLSSDCTETSSSVNESSIEDTSAIERERQSVEKRDDEVKGGTIIARALKPLLPNMRDKEAVHSVASLAVISILLRILRRWNQTGNKWLNVPDIGDWLVEPHNKGYLSCAAIFSLLVIGASRGPVLKRSMAMFINLALVAVYLHRAATGSLFFPHPQVLSVKGIIEARASYLFIAIAVVLSILPKGFFDLDMKEKSIIGDYHKEEKCSESTQSTELSAPYSESNDVHEQTITSRLQQGHQLNLPLSEKDKKNSKPNTTLKELHSDRMTTINSILTAWLCLVCLLVRPHNIPIVAMMSLMEQLATHVIVRCDLHANNVLIYCVWMGHAFFFFQGNSNSVSTLDVSAGYVGLVDYNPVLIGLLMALATYAGPIFWVLTFVKMIYLKQNRQNKSRSSFSYRSSFQALMLMLIFPLAVYSVLVAAQRYHLFVWTVFSPKLLYLGATSASILSITVIAFVISYTISRHL